MSERVLDRVVEWMRRTPAWDEVRRADLVGAPGAADRQRPAPADEGFSDAWGRAELRHDDADEHPEYPGFGGAA